MKKILFLIMILPSISFSKPSRVPAQEDVLWARYQKGLTVMTVKKESYSPLLDKKTKTDGKLFLEKNKLRLETSESLILINGKKLTVVVYQEDHNMVLQGVLEPSDFLYFISSLDLKKCIKKDLSLNCDKTTFDFNKDKEITKITAAADDIDNKSYIEINKTEFNSQEKVSFEYTPKKNDDVQILKELGE